MAIEPEEFFNYNQSVDFEIALTALIASTVSFVPRVLGEWSYIPIGFGIGLLILTLIRKMLIMVEENEATYLNSTMYFIGFLSAIAITYIFYSISVSITNLLPFPANPLDIMTGLSLFLVFEVLVFHILVTKDFPDYLYFTIKHKIENSRDTWVSNNLGAVFDSIVSSQIRRLPKELISDRLKQEVDVSGLKESSSNSFLWSTLGVLLVSFLLTVSLHFLNLSMLRYFLISIIPMLILLPLRMWYVVYGNARPDQIFGIRFYFSILVITAGFLFLIYG
jgi:hypothetical protein